MNPFDTGMNISEKRIQCASENATKSEIRSRIIAVRKNAVSFAPLFIERKYRVKMGTIQGKNEVDSVAKNLL
jgi:hypothetical protein